MKRQHLLIVFAATLAVLSCDQLFVDEFQPTGTTFNLNSDIEVVAITGNPNLNDYGPFTLGMTIASKTSDVETDVLPAGLLMKRRINNTQHMVLLKDQTITTGTGSKTELLGVFCCNQNRPSPDAGDTFDLGPETDDAGLRQIVNIVKGKRISDGNDMWMVQRAVYLVTDSTGLTQAYIDSLHALPDEPGRGPVSRR